MLKKLLKGTINIYFPLQNVINRVFFYMSVDNDKNVKGSCEIEGIMTLLYYNFLTPPPLGISGLFRSLCSISYSWSLTFTFADSPLRVIPDFDLHRNHAGAHNAYS